MALTGRIVANIYAINGVPFKEVGEIQGRTHSLPSDECYFYPAAAGETAEGVTINSIIVLLPTGSRSVGTTYYTNLTVAGIASAGS